MSMLEDQPHPAASMSINKAPLNSIRSHHSMGVGHSFVGHTSTTSKVLVSFVESETLTLAMVMC